MCWFLNINSNKAPIVEKLQVLDVIFTHQLSDQAV